MPVTVPIIGRPDEVELAIRRQHALGLLVGDPADLRPARTKDGRMFVRATLLIPGKPARRKDDTSRAIMSALVFALILLTLGGIMIAAVIMLAGKAILTLGGIILVCAALAGIGMRSGTKSCPGVTTHCPPAHHK